MSDSIASICNHNWTQQRWDIGAERSSKECFKTHAQKGDGTQCPRPPKPDLCASTISCDAGSRHSVQTLRPFAQIVPLLMQDAPSHLVRGNDILTIHVSALGAESRFAAQGCFVNTCLETEPCWAVTSIIQSWQWPCTACLYTFT